MKKLFIVTAVIEGATGALFFIWPSLPVMLLLGMPLGSPVALVVARITGAAMLALGLACWFARRDPLGYAARGLAVALSLYNAAALSVLAYAGTVLGLGAMGLWPAVLVHSALFIWCVRSLLKS